MPTSNPTISMTSLTPTVATSILTGAPTLPVESFGNHYQSKSIEMILCIGALYFVYVLLIIVLVVLIRKKMIELTRLNELSYSIVDHQ